MGVAKDPAFWRTRSVSVPRPRGRSPRRHGRRQKKNPRGKVHLSNLNAKSRGGDCRSADRGASTRWNVAFRCCAAGCKNNPCWWVIPGLVGKNRHLPKGARKKRRGLKHPNTAPIPPSIFARLWARCWPGHRYRGDFEERLKAVVTSWKPIKDAVLFHRTRFTPSRCGLQLPVGAMDASTC